MKAILRVRYDKTSDFHDLVFCFNKVGDETIYKLLDSLDRQYGSCRFRYVEFINDDDNFNFKIRQKVFFTMVELAKPRFKYFIDDIIFHDKIKLFTVSVNVDKLFWLVGDDYSRLLDDEQLNNYQYQLQYDLRSGATLYVIDLVNGTIEEIEANNLVQVN